MRDARRVATAGVFAAVLCAGLAVPGAAAARTRSACEDGVSLVQGALSRPQRPETRAALERALRAARRELREAGYDECLEAVDDARAALGETVAVRPSARDPAEDERVQADPRAPVSVEDAWANGPGEVDLRLELGHDRLRRRAAGEDGARRYGRDLLTPEAVVEVGLGHGLEFSLSTAYGFGNAEEARSGEVGLGLKWNLLPPGGGLRPSVALEAEVLVPHGPRRGPVEGELLLIVSQPLGRGAGSPFLHGNLTWIRAREPEAGEERRDRYAAALAVAAPVGPSTALFVGGAREQAEERRRTRTLLEFGLRHVLPGEFVLAAGVGVGVGDSDTRLRATVAVQRDF